MAKYVCKICNIVYKARSGLYYHMKGVHQVSAKSIVFCTECNRPFSSLSHLQQHMKVHNLNTIKKKFKCFYCEQIFLSKSIRSKHSKIDHKEQSEERLKKKCFDCFFCEKRFSRKTNRIKHERACKKDPSHVISPNASAANQTISVKSKNGSKLTQDETEIINPDADTDLKEGIVLEEIPTSSNTLYSEEGSCLEARIFFISRKNLKRQTQTVPPSTLDNPTSLKTKNRSVPKSDDSNIAVPETSRKLHPANMPETPTVLDSSTDVTPELRHYLRDRKPFMRLGSPDVETPWKAKYTLKEGQNLVHGLKKENQALKQQIWRLKQKIKSLQDTLINLVEKS